MSKQTAMTLFVNDTLKGEVKEVSYYLEMEKQQIIDACNQIEVIGLDHELAGEKYYNKTFNK